MPDTAVNSQIEIIVLSFTRLSFKKKALFLDICLVIHKKSLDLFLSTLVYVCSLFLILTLSNELLCCSWKQSPVFVFLFEIKNNKLEDLLQEPGYYAVVIMIIM